MKQWYRSETEILKKIVLSKKKKEIKLSNILSDQLIELV